MYAQPPNERPPHDPQNSRPPLPPESDGLCCRLHPPPSTRIPSVVALVARGGPPAVAPLRTLIPPISPAAPPAQPLPSSQRMMIPPPIAVVCVAIVVVIAPASRGPGAAGPVSVWSAIRRRGRRRLMPASALAHRVHPPPPPVLRHPACAEFGHRPLSRLLRACFEKRPRNPALGLLGAQQKLPQLDLRVDVDDWRRVSGVAGCWVGARWRMTKAYHECGCALGSVAEERDQLYHDRFGVHALLLEKREEEVLENLAALTDGIQGNSEERGEPVGGRSKSSVEEGEGA